MNRIKGGLLSVLCCRCYGRSRKPRQSPASLVPRQATQITSSWRVLCPCVAWRTQTTYNCFQNAPDTSRFFTDKQKRASTQKWGCMQASADYVVQWLLLWKPRPSLAAVEQHGRSGTHNSAERTCPRNDKGSTKPWNSRRMIHCDLHSVHAGKWRRRERVRATVLTSAHIGREIHPGAKEQGANQH